MNKAEDHDMGSEIIDDTNVLFQKIQDLINEGRWAVFISEWSSRKVSHKSIPLAYTVGLMAKGFPELMVCGLSDIASNKILNDAAALLIRGEL